MAASITVHLQIFKRPYLPHFSTDLDKTGIKIHGLLRSFIQNIVIIRVAVPFNFSNSNNRRLTFAHVAILLSSTQRVAEYLVALKHFDYS